LPEIESSNEPNKEERKKEEPNKEAVTPRTMHGEIVLFAKQIDALAETLPMATLAIQGAHDSSRQQLVKFLADECKVVRSGDKVTYAFEGGQYLRFQKLMGRVQKTELAQQLVPSGLLVSLVSQFDAYLGGLIRQLFRIKPEILNSSANTLTYSQLVEFGSIENAREYVVAKEVESVLRKSHGEQFDWLENKIGLPLRKDLNAWPVFVEVTERRNLFVHSGGAVSHQYLEVCKRNLCSIGADLCPGKSLSVTREYFAAAHDCLFEIGVKLAQVLWRKLQPDDLERADASLNSVIYDLLVEGRYRLARVLSDFGTETLKKHAKEESLLILVLNRAQAYKWSGDEETARKIVNAEDWGAKALRFKMVQSVLLDDFKAAIDIMKQIGADGDINKHFYREWPVFKEIRKSQEFAVAFEEIFGEPLNLITVPREDTQGPGKQTIN